MRALRAREGSRSMSADATPTGSPAPDALPPIPRPLPAHPGWLEVHRARLRDQVHRHDAARRRRAPSRAAKEHRMTPAVDHIPAGTAEHALPAGVWRVDARRSEIGFAVRDLWGLRTVRGIFGAYDGSLTVRAGDAAGELLIEARSLDTGNNRRDQHLRPPAFFDVERHPRIVFTTTAAAARDGGVAVTGVWRSARRRCDSRSRRRSSTWRTARCASKAGRPSAVRQQAWPGTSWG